VETTTTTPGGTTVQGETFQTQQHKTIQTYLKDFTTVKAQAVTSVITNIDTDANTFEQVVFVRQPSNLSKIDLNFTMSIPNGSNVTKFTSWSYGSAGSYDPNTNPTVDYSSLTKSIIDQSMISQNVSWISNDNLLIVIKGQYNDTMPSSSLETKFIFNGKTEYAGYEGSSYDLNGPYTFSTSLPMTPGQSVDVTETT